MSATPGDATVALTQANGAPAPEQEPTLLGLGAEGWVYVGLTIFLLLAVFIGKLPRRITEALDARIAETRRELDRARSIREDAERLLAEAQARSAASLGDAEAIVAHAEQEAAALVAEAKAAAADLVKRRTKMAEDKIGAAERAAIAEVRAHAADAAIKAATATIAEKHGAAADKPLVDKTIAGLGRVN
jgi:F-type H+-transporting ATPase subunit b